MKDVAVRVVKTMEKWRVEFIAEGWLKTSEFLSDSEAFGEAARLFQGLKERAEEKAKADPK